ncbi:hypothetical protein D3C81_1394020 [compost metagenome]
MRLEKMLPMASSTCFFSVMPFLASCGNSTFSNHSNWFSRNSSAPSSAPGSRNETCPALSCLTLLLSPIRPNSSSFLADRLVVRPWYKFW